MGTRLSVTAEAAALHVVPTARGWKRQILQTCLVVLMVPSVTELLLGGAAVLGNTEDVRNALWDMTTCALPLTCVAEVRTTAVPGALISVPALEVFGNVVQSSSPTTTASAVSPRLTKLTMETAQRPLCKGG